MAAAAAAAAGGAGAGDDGGGIIRHYEPTYRMKPSDEHKFQPAVVKKVCEDVVNGALAGKAWNGEEETVWTVGISEQIKAKVRGTWPCAWRLRVARQPEPAPGRVP